MTNHIDPTPKCEGYKDCQEKPVYRAIWPDGSRLFCHEHYSEMLKVCREFYLKEPNVEVINEGQSHD